MTPSLGLSKEVWELLMKTLLPRMPSNRKEQAELSFRDPVDWVGKQCLGETTSQLRTINMQIATPCGRVTTGRWLLDSCFKALLPCPGLETPSKLVWDAVQLAMEGAGLFNPDTWLREPGEELAELCASLRLLPWAGVGRWCKPC